MKVALLTREYPPEVYGGAGVHVEFLTRELRRLVEVDVCCFGADRTEPGVRAFRPGPELATANPALQALGVDVDMAATVAGADLVHSHTWYANFAGLTAGRLHGIPHVLTAHSLEPARPWKADQLGGGYRLSSWIEQEAYRAADAVIAVSAGMREDILRTYPFVAADRVHVIHNGIDTALYRPVDGTATARARGIDPDRPSALFVGRITRQKGLQHLLAAARRFNPDIQLVLCAGAPDTAQLATDTEAAVAALDAQRDGVIWIRDMLARAELIALLSVATVFVCPSVYEPLGIVNLEAMACGTAVVASAVGGIPEVVIGGRTGLLVPHDPQHPEQLEAGLAAAVNRVCADPALATRLAAAGRERAVADFGWDTIAARTVALYRELLAG